jgi:hypothetical protein
VIPPGPRWRSLPAQDHRRDAAGDRRQTGSKAEEAVPSRAGGPDEYSAFVCAVIEIQPPSPYMNLVPGWTEGFALPAHGALWRGRRRSLYALPLPGLNSAVSSTDPYRVFALWC